MKRFMQSVAMSATIVTVLAAAVVEVARPTGVQAQGAGRCTGDVEPVCATATSCRGIWWWKECVDFGGGWMAPITKWLFGLVMDSCVEYHYYYR